MFATPSIIQAPEVKLSPLMQSIIVTTSLSLCFQGLFASFSGCLVISIAGMIGYLVADWLEEKASNGGCEQPWRWRMLNSVVDFMLGEKVVEEAPPLEKEPVIEEAGGTDDLSSDELIRESPVTLSRLDMDAINIMIALFKEELSDDDSFEALQEAKVKHGNITD